MQENCVFIYTHGKQNTADNSDLAQMLLSATGKVCCSSFTDALKESIGNYSHGDVSMLLAQAPYTCRHCLAMPLFKYRLSLNLDSKYLLS
jgi:hypothetical protein